MESEAVLKIDIDELKKTFNENPELFKIIKKPKKVYPYTCPECKTKYEKEGHHKCKSGVNDIADFLELKQVIDLAMNVQPYYWWEPKKEVRDRALIAALALTGLRISELLSVTKENLVIEKDGVWLKNVIILKRRVEHVIKDFYLPREGVLGPLTERFLAHANNVKKGRLFDFTRVRAWQIVNKLTGKWCHYFRSQRLSYLVNKFRSTVIVSSFQGIKKSSTIDHYYKGGQEHFKEELTPR